jgi:hypothetical protein
VQLGPGRRSPVLVVRPNLSAIGRPVLAAAPEVLRPHPPSARDPRANRLEIVPSSSVTPRDAALRPPISTARRH